MWTWGAFLALGAMPIYSMLVSRMGKQRLALRVYLVVATALAIFAGAFRWYSNLGLETGSTASGSGAILNKSFYIATSLYSMFVVSVLWSVLTGAFDSRTSKQIVGRVFAAGTIGGICASFFVSQTADFLDPEYFLVFAAMLLIPSAWALNGLAMTEPEATDEGNLASPNRLSTGIGCLKKSHYLQGIGGYLFLFVLGSSFLYFIQSELVRELWPDRGERRTVLGKLDMTVQILTVLSQLFLTSGMIRRWGMPIALTVVPVISILGFSALALWPTFATLAVFSVLRRSSNYAIAKPSREVLYTVVTSEERYLTKPFLDVGVYRFGDLLSAWLFEGARVAMAVGISGMALFAVPFCLAWIPVARYLGRRQEEQARER